MDSYFLIKWISDVILLKISLIKANIKCFPKSFISNFWGHFNVV